MDEEPVMKKFSFLKIISLLLILNSLPLYASYRDTIEKSFKVREGGTLTIESDLGSIEVITHKENQVDIEIIREINVSSDREAERILDDLDISFDNRGDDVYIRAEFKRNRDRWFRNGNRRLRLEFNVIVPEIYNVDLQTSGGSISVDDLEGYVNAKTSGGSLKFGDIKGPVKGTTSGGSIQLTGSEGDSKLNTSGGGITIGDVNGDIEATTSGGSIRIDRAEGKVIANTSGGGIQVDEVMGDIDAHTSGGSISAYISEQPRGDCSLTTSGGGIIVKLAEDVKAYLDAKTSGGGVQTDFPVTVRGKIKKNELQAAINGGGPRLYLRTSGGSIHIREM